MRFDNASIVVYYCLIQMNIINLGILAHIDAGKTSVTENLLFASGATEKCGRVDNGDTITDSMDIEKRRGITAQWKFSGDKHKSLQVYTERTFHQRYLLVML